MLLLILVSASLVLCAAQTEPFTSSDMGMSAVTPLPQPFQETSVLPSPDPMDNIVAILQTAAWSYRELNETTAAPVLNKLYDIIHKLQPNLNFTLTLKNITKV